MHNYVCVTQRHGARWGALHGRACAQGNPVSGTEGSGVCVCVCVRAVRAGTELLALQALGQVKARLSLAVSRVPFLQRHTHTHTHTRSY